MSIRARLTITIAVIIVFTIALLGWAMVETTEATLIRQIDEQVIAQAERRAQGPNSYDQAYSASRYDDTAQGYQVAEGSGDGADRPWQWRGFATLVYAPDGTVLSLEPYGYRDNAASPPKCPDIPSPELDAILDRVVTLPSHDGTLHYRTLVQQLPNGQVQAVGAPLTDVQQAVDDLLRRVATGGALAVLTAAGLSWWSIRRGLQPVDHMVDTAAAIAAGNLGARINNPEPGTELGRLGTALNDMLTHIQTADDARSASERRLRRFVADAAHELRTPLTSLRGYAELYRQGALPTDAALSNAMGRIESEGSRMARLVDDLLLLARMDQARGVERQPVDLGAMVTDAVADFQVVAPNHPVSLDVQPVVVAGDRLRLRQVIDNLLSNVRTHTPAGTLVEVFLRQENAMAVVTVTDHGPGVSPEDQGHIFERFWRADPARTRSRGGTGLGLAIVASLVEAHGGSIALTSEVGTGTTFIVSVPVDDPAPPESSPFGQDGGAGVTPKP